MEYFTARKKTAKSINDLIAYRISELDKEIYYEERPWLKLMKDVEETLNNQCSLKEFQDYLSFHKGDRVSINSEIGKRIAVKKRQISKFLAIPLSGTENYISQKNDEIKKIMQSYYAPGMMSTVSKSVKNKLYNVIQGFLENKISKRMEYVINKIINIPSRFWRLESIIMGIGNNKEEYNVDLNLFGRHYYFWKIQKNDISIDNVIETNYAQFLKNQKKNLRQLITQNSTKKFLREAEDLGEQDLKQVLEFQLNTIYIKQVINKQYDHELFLESEVFYSLTRHFELLSLKRTKFIPVMFKRFLNRYFLMTPIRRLRNTAVHKVNEFKFGDKYYETLADANISLKSGELIKKYNQLFPKTFNFWLQKIENPKSIPV